MEIIFGCIALWFYWKRLGPYFKKDAPRLKITDWVFGPEKQK